LKGFSKSSLSEANRKRDWRIFRDIFYILRERLEGVTPRHGFKFRNKLYLLDSTFIELILSLFAWAVYKKRKGKINLHTLIDTEGMIPEVVIVSEARSHDLAYAEDESI
jgi:putative transposase